LQKIMAIRYYMQVDYSVKVKEFEGPLELLLELIENRKLSVNEISLASVTEEYFHNLEKIKNERRATYHTDIASFLVIAATLMLIKSRSLLPGFYVTEEEQADINELEERLKIYKHIKDIATKLGELDTNRRPLFAREPLIFEKPTFLPPTKPLDLTSMLGMLKVLASSIPQKNELPERTLKKIVSIEQRIEELGRRIHERMQTTFTEFITDKTERTDVIISFLAMLELVKMGSISVTQSELFNTIHIQHQQ